MSDFGYSAGCGDGRTVWVPLGRTVAEVCASGSSPLNPNPNVKVINGLGGSEYLNSPSGPNATVIQTYTEATGQPEVDPAAAAATGNPAPGGCCADGEADCWKCWVRDHGKWLLILALAILAYLTRRK